MITYKLVKPLNLTILLCATKPWVFSVVIDKLSDDLKKPKPSIKVVNEPVPGIDKILTVLAETIEHSIFPLVRSMDKKLEIDLRTHDKMKDLSQQLRTLEAQVIGKTDKGSTS